MILYFLAKILTRLHVKIGHGVTFMSVVGLGTSVTFNYINSRKNASFRKEIMEHLTVIENNQHITHKTMHEKVKAFSDQKIKNDADLRRTLDSSSSYDYYLSNFNIKDIINSWQDFMNIK